MWLHSISEFGKIRYMNSAEILKRIRAMSEAERREVHLATGIPEPTLAKIRYGVTNDPRSSTMDALRAYFDGIAA